ncbi:hypothetical protein P0O24_01135 [Methanotrichaceae archaeon M04Ac]|uniref:Uncharacterized protein n=1 Tax=Candidatus Methanocrinis alkalitolerans TaxID=3033395 RepID=A0ABT5XBU9_9EURY|nr:hypothetical protein [Candidatus Methanocrinis alkalitolerans]MDF0592189.1 hypothetical protein [Candidatus Methanocrinis alkalitolerans]
MVAVGNEVLKQYPYSLAKVSNDPLKIIDMVLTERNIITLPDTL